MPPGKDRSASLTKNLAPYEPPQLRFLDAKGKPTSSLDIANLLDGSLTGSKSIGFQKNGKKYLIDYEGQPIRERITTTRKEL